MEQFIIQGGIPLSGTIVPSGNKNAALPILAATLLTDKPVTLHNLPNIGDVRTMMTLLEDLGATIQRHDNHSVTIRAEEIRSTCPDPALFSEIRGSLTLLGPMLARAGEIELSLPGEIGSAGGAWTRTCWPWKHWGPASNSTTGSRCTPGDCAGPASGWTRRA